MNDETISEMIIKCPACGIEGVAKSIMKELEIPHFGQVMETTLLCPNCGFKHSDIIALEQNDPAKYIIEINKNNLSVRVVRSQSATVIIPEIGIRYTPRDTIGKLSKMLYHYGLWKPLVNKKVGNAVSYRQFAPPMFFAFFVFGLILGILFPPILTIWAFVMIFYFAIAFAIGVKYAIKHKRASLCIMMPITFFCMHISYGYGYIKGLLFNNSLSYKIDR